MVVGPYNTPNVINESDPVKVELPIALPAKTTPRFAGPKSEASNDKIGEL